MSVKHDSSGRRYVEAEVEVPGTPEQVWEAIATSDGVSSWFVTSEFRDDGTIVSHFGPGMDAVATRTAWEPPRRFAAEGAGLAPGAPPVATEWFVEAREGGTCVVRVVHSLFTSSDEGDDQLGAVESGWPAFFRILRLYLSHFRGQAGRAVQLIGMSQDPPDAVWHRLTSSLGLSNAAAGERRAAPDGAPAFAGRVEAAGAAGQPELLLTLETPAPGIAHLIVLPMGGAVCASMRLYLYGDAGRTAAARDAQAWEAWMALQCPPAAVPAGERA